jgi:hypothetical protein
MTSQQAALDSTTSLAAYHTSGIACVYDKRAAVFTGLAAEADPPRKQVKTLIDGQEMIEYRPLITWWRSPFMASFRAGDFDFIAVAAHIRWDASGGEESRKRELQLLAQWIDKRSKEKHVVDKDIIVMGDFNIPAVGDDLYNAVTSCGLRMPSSLVGTHGSNLAKDKRYDQILHLPTFTKSFTDQGGVLDFYVDGHKQLFPGQSIPRPLSPTRSPTTCPFGCNSTRTSTTSVWIKS